MRRAVAALLLTLAAGTARAGAPLTPGEVQAFLAGFADAERAGDVAALDRALAPDCRVELRVADGGREHVTALTHDEYVADLGEFYASLPTLAAYQYEAAPARITVADDGATATAARQVTESFTVDGERHVFRLEQTARIERRDGRLAITTFATRSRPD